MKYKSDFVTNSSSSSYIVSLTKDFKIETTDPNLKDFIICLNDEFESLFSDYESINSDYGIIKIVNIEDLIGFIYDRCYDNEFKTQLYKLKSVKEHLKIKELKKLLKQNESDYDYEYHMKCINELSKGNKIYKLSSSHHNIILCQMIKLIINSKGCTLIEDCSG